MLKTAYRFDEETKEFLDKVQVQESPLEKGVWLMPDNCTFDRPMGKQEHAIPCYKNGAWVLVADYRKCDFYDKVTQEKHTITELGVEPENDWTEKVPTDPEQVWNGREWVLPASVVLARAKQSKLTELKIKRDNSEESPVHTELGDFDFDTKARDRINGAKDVLNGTTETLEWTLANNEVVEVGYNDLKAVTDTAAVRCNALHLKYRDLRELVRRATTVEQVDAISWDIIKGGNE